MQDDSVDFPALLALLESKRQLVLHLLTLTTDMGNALCGEDFARLEELLEERQQGMNSLAAVNVRIDLTYLAVRSALSVDGGRIFGMREGEISTLMQALLEQDRQVHSNMQAALQAVKQKSDELLIQKRGLTAYGESQQAPSGALVSVKK